MSTRFWQIVGLAAVGGAGYYLYNAGGDPKAAQKRVEADAAKLSSQVKDSLPGKTKEIKKDAEVTAADAGKKLDDMAASAKQTVTNVDRKLEGYRKDAETKVDSGVKDVQRDAKAAVDSFDRNVQEGASKAKTSVSSWFGGSK